MRKGDNIVNGCVCVCDPLVALKPPWLAFLEHNTCTVKGLELPSTSSKACALVAADGEASGPRELIAIGWASMGTSCPGKNSGVSNWRVPSSHSHFTGEVYK